MVLLGDKIKILKKNYHPRQSPFCRDIGEEIREQKLASLRVLNDISIPLMMFLE